MKEKKKKKSERDETSYRNDYGMNALKRSEMNECLEKETLFIKILYGRFIQILYGRFWHMTRPNFTGFFLFAANWILR